MVGRQASQPMSPAASLPVSPKIKNLLLNNTLLSTVFQVGARNRKMKRNAPHSEEALV